jgi:DNA-binding NarL/FixJ family response regulator
MAIRVLLVDDNPEIASNVEALLGVTEVEFRVFEVGRLSDALNAPATNLILLDLNLPDSSGLETILAIARERPEVPVIVMTGDGDGGIAASALAAGAQSTIPKSEMTTASLINAMRGALRTHRIVAGHVRLRIDNTCKVVRANIKSIQTAIATFETTELTATQSEMSAVVRAKSQEIVVSLDSMQKQT